jgi:hypothetical protein
MSSLHRQTLAALEKLKSGAVSLDSEDYLALLEAIEQATEALHAAPRKADQVALGLWYNHERAPALARLADALQPHRVQSAVDLLAADLNSDVMAARALQQSLEDARR